MTQVTNDNRIELLHCFFSAATHDASAAMCRWTGGLISMQLDEVQEIPLEEVCAEYDFGDGPLTMIVLSLQGELGGDMILAFDDDNGRRLAAMLLKQPPSAAAEWSPREKSALMETGNILGCAYMNALTRLVGTQLVPSPPTFLQDYGASVLQQALVTQAMTCEKVLICRTRFEERGAALDWNVFFVPSVALRAAMQDALDN